MAKKKSETIEFDKETLLIFASRAKELRLERDISREALGKYLGYSASSIYCYENATRVADIKVLSAYSNFFDVPVDYLIGKTDVRKPLYRIACFSNLSDKDIGYLSDEAQEDISKFIEYVMAKEKNKKNENK